MATIYWKKGETKQKLIVRVVNARGDGPDFTDVTSVTFLFKTTGGLLISKTGAVESIANCELSWTPAADESDYGATTSTLNGGADYDMEVKVVWTTTESKYPTKGYAVLAVQQVLS